MAIRTVKIWLRVRTRVQQDVGIVPFDTRRDHPTVSWREAVLRRILWSLEPGMFDHKNRLTIAFQLRRLIHRTRRCRVPSLLAGAVAKLRQGRTRRLVIVCRNLQAVTVRIGKVHRIRLLVVND